jgi:hypothetical protein
VLDKAGGWWYNKYKIKEREEIQMEYTKEMILTLAEELKIEKKKTITKPHYYKRGGKMVERSYPDVIYTDRYKELFFNEESPLRSAKVFKSEPSNTMVAYLDLELWCCDFKADYYISSFDYEEEMGDDL